MIQESEFNKFKHTHKRKVSPIWQVLPVHCGRHKQSKPFSRSKQVPPWAHGLEAHSSLSAQDTRNTIVRKMSINVHHVYCKLRICFGTEMWTLTFSTGGPIPAWWTLALEPWRQFMTGPAICTWVWHAGVLSCKVHKNVFNVNFRLIYAYLTLCII